MLIFITLTLCFLILFSIYLFRTRFDYVGSALITIAGIAFIVHIASLVMSKYTCDYLIAERYSITYSLQNSRKNMTDLEKATVIRDVIAFNTSLMKYRVNNDDLFLGVYTDDRIENIEPIQ